MNSLNVSHQTMTVVYFDGLTPGGFSTPYIAPVNTVNQTGTTSTSQAVLPRIFRTRVGRVVV